MHQHLITEPLHGNTLCLNMCHGSGFDQRAPRLDTYFVFPTFPNMIHLVKLLRCVKDSMSVAEGCFCHMQVVVDKNT